jgi:nitrous oxidase accessory protein NosD
LNNSFGMFVLASNNLIYNNNFIDNYRQASAFADNVFNLSEAEGGGNYWSNWCPPEHPDSDGDGFVDEPYVFYGGPDNLPWAIPNGWVNQAPLGYSKRLGQPGTGGDVPGRDSDGGQLL